MCVCMCNLFCKKQMLMPTYTHTHTCTHTYICVCSRVCVCIYVCMYVCEYKSVIQISM